ncbi:hypothetical protein ACTHT5_11320, partial [Neisseria sp. P0022.S002]
GDGFMCAVCRIWGQKILRFELSARVMVPKRYAQVYERFDKYGNWVLFVVRFLPCLRAAVFVAAGISCRVSCLRFILVDGLVVLVFVGVGVWCLFGGLVWFLVWVGLLFGLGGVFVFFFVVFLLFVFFVFCFGWGGGGCVLLL